MKSVDLDGNGTIDYNEFLAATLNRTKILSKQNLEAAFKMFDKVTHHFIIISFLKILKIDFRTEAAKSVLTKLCPFSTRLTLLIRRNSRRSSARPIRMVMEKFLSKSSRSSCPNSSKFS